MALDLLIKAARIIDPRSTHHDQVRDILIRSGKITQIGADLSSDAELSKEIVSGSLDVFEQENCHLSPGWFDSYASFCDPGYEHREDLKSGTAAAAAGGFTAVACLPNTMPVLHSKAEIEYVINKAANSPVNVHPIGAISRDLAGTDITEMNDMRAAGAIAFGEGNKPLHHPGLLLRALLYAKPFGGVIINMAMEPRLAGAGQMHEGEMSTVLGMQGIPVLAESVMLQRDISIAEYTEGRLHFPLLSSKEGVEMVRAAKAKGVKVSAGVSAYQLLLEDSALESYDSNFKVNPPLRGKEDRLALLEGLLDGTIDLVCSNHLPQDEDAKKVEFEYASNGIGSIELTFSLLLKAISETKGADFSLSALIDKISTAPRKLFGLSQPLITEGESAEFTLFDPQANWEVTDLKSQAMNNPFAGQKLPGKVWGVFNKGKLSLR